MPIFTEFVIGWVHIPVLSMDNVVNSNARCLNFPHLKYRELNYLKHICQLHSWGTVSTFQAQKHYMSSSPVPLCISPIVPNSVMHKSNLFTCFPWYFIQETTKELLLSWIRTMRPSFAKCVPKETHIWWELSMQKCWTAGHLLDDYL